MAQRDPAGPTTLQQRLDPSAGVGSVALTVADLERSRRFYTDVLGMHELGSGVDGALRLGGPDKTVLVELTGDPEAAPFDPGRPGLFHFAVLVPSRFDLARALAGIAVARWPLTGASDHLVSEALYLRDPDGNGIEIYRDRPRSEWRHEADGAIAMATLPLDLDDLLTELPKGAAGTAARDLAAATQMGHIHLQVSELARTEAFYDAVLGFDVTVRGYPGALFLSAGGYHHHIGLNTWNSRGASAPAAGGVGLRWYTVHTGSQAGLAGALERVERAGLLAEMVPGGALVTDPSANRALLTV